MYTYDFNFISSAGRATFSIKSPENDEPLKEIVHALIEPFIIPDPQDASQKAIEVIKRYDQDCQLVFRKIIDLYSTGFIHIRQLDKFFSTLKQNEYFACVPPAERLRQEIFHEISLRLQSLNGGEAYEVLKDNYDKTLKHLFDDYNVKTLGQWRDYIGNREERKCRFCFKKPPLVSFKNKAHAISQGIGNNNVISLDECDDCNERFSREIEPSLISYLSLYRAIFGIKGRNGIKKIKANKFELFRQDGEVIINMKDNLRPVIEDDKYQISLPQIGRYTPSSVYKCLVKYFLSVVDHEYLEGFKDTIKWVNGEQLFENELPKVAVSLNNQEFTEFPIITIFIRKRPIFEIPYAFAELRFTIFRYVYLIPFSKEDQKHFLSEDEYSVFWKYLKHFKDKSWVFEDFSRTDELNLNFNMKIDLTNLNPKLATGTTVLSADNS